MDICFSKSFGWNSFSQFWYQRHLALNSIVSNFLTKLFQDEVTPTKCISDILEWAAASDKPPYSNITIQVRQQQNFLANPRKPGGPISKLIEKVISNYPRSDDIQVGTKGVRKTTSLRANIEWLQVGQRLKETAVCGSLIVIISGAPSDSSFRPSENMRYWWCTEKITKSTKV